MQSNNGAHRRARSLGVVSNRKRRLISEQTIEELTRRGADPEVIATMRAANQRVAKLAEKTPSN